MIDYDEIILKYKQGIQSRLFAEFLNEFESLRKQKEELARTRQEEQNLRLARENFIDITSHKLRTPLSEIRWLLELILAGKFGEVPEKLKKELDKVYLSDLRIIGLVNTLLLIPALESKKIKTTSQKVDVGELAEEVVSDNIFFSNSYGVEITLKKEEKNPPVASDRHLLKEVIRHLLTNAIIYGKKGGKAAIEIKKDGESVLFKISDDGVGIPESEREKIFSEIYRGSNVLKISTEGTGLGLYFSKLIIEQSGGKIWFESKEGKGSVFYFTLPTAK
ncbi:MAG: HAMP domain-containing sensor histidine kinase [Patescibacteria group bacterium]